MGIAPIIELSGVAIEFGELVVHKNISFKVDPAETVTLLGPSGIGKTLILKMIMGLLPPSKGKILVMGQNVPDLSEQELSRLRKNIGILFQGAALFDSLSVYENIAYALREEKNKTEQEISDIVHEKLEIVGLPGIDFKNPSELSGGQKKRVGLARALASSPSIVLFDEPTTGLDPTAIRLIDDLILKLKQDFQITCVAVTHDIESARRFSDRWILLNNGRVVADGSVEQVSRENRQVIDFISGNWRSELHCV